MAAIRLYFLNLWVRQRKLLELARVVVRYYWRFEFAWTDLRLWWRYLFVSPYQVSKGYLAGRGEEDVYTYGETPLTTLEQIMEEAGVGPSDVVYELGCGTGRTCLWLRRYLGCRVVGVERIPHFVETARDLIGDVTFLQDDFGAVDYSKATVVYLYGTCLEGGEIEAVERALESLPPGARVISVSYPLHSLELIKRFPARFTWGKADVYLSLR